MSRVGERPPSRKTVELTAVQRVALSAAADAELRGEQTAAQLAAADFDLVPSLPRNGGVIPCTQPGIDPEDWFPLISTEVTAGDDPDGHLAAQERELAARLCAGCPVTAECLALSLSKNIGWDIGIWGQTGARDRAAMRAQHKAAQ